MAASPPRVSIALTLTLALLGCADDLAESRVSPLYPGAPTPPCVECGPGAMRQGRQFLGSDAVVAVGPADQVARAAGTYVHWLDADLGIADTREIESLGRIDALAIDADGAGAAVIEWSEDALDPPELALFGIGRTPPRATWYGRLQGMFPAALAVSPDRIFLAESSLTAPLMFGVRRRDDGEVVTSAMLGVVAIAADPSGGAIIAGGFTGTLALGGTAPALVATGAGSGFVAAIDAGGLGRWAIALAAQGTGSPRGSVIEVATDAAGNVALVGRWSGDTAQLGGVALSSQTASINGDQVVAMLDHDGAVRWTHELRRGADDRIMSIATDGTTVFVGGAYADAPLGLDPAALPPIEQDGFAAALTAAGPAWVRLARGPGIQDVSIAGLTSRGVIATIRSDVRSVEPSYAYGDAMIEGRGVVVAELAP